MPRAAAFRQAGVKAEKHEKRIQEAIAGVREKKYPNISIACRELGLGAHYYTVYRRFNGKTKPRLAAHAEQQLLNPAQETILRNWIKFLGMVGIPLSKRTITPKLMALCGQNPGRDWVNRFVRRNPDCTLGRPSKLDTKRATQFNYTVVNKHFESLQQLFNGREIPLHNLFNADEIGIQPGVRDSSNELYLYSSADKSRYKLSHEDLQLVTVIETVCADGTSTVKPCFVFAGTHYSEDWFNVPGSDGVLIATSDNGWTSEKICYDWFTKNFIRDAKAHADPSAPVVLIYDGHNSHTTEQMIEAALANNIILYLLPPHTTHRLQPCDVGAFGPLKHAWNRRCEEVFAKLGEGLRLADVVREYLPVRSIAFKESTIRKAWEKSGIGIDEDGRPKCLPDIFDWADFAPSISSSTQLHLPEGYPTALGLDQVFTESSSSESESDDDRPDDDNEHESHQPSRRSHRIQSRLAAASVEQPRSHSGTSAMTKPMGRYEDGDHNSDPDLDCDLDSMSPDMLKTYVTKLRLKVKHSEQEVKAARQQHDEARTHAILAASHIQELQGQLNTKAAKKNSARNVFVHGRVISTEEGRLEAQRQKAVREAKVQKENERKQKKLDDALDTQQRRTRDGKHGMSFSGTLKTHKLPTLRDIAWTLELSEDGTRDELITRINMFFDDPANRGLRASERYIGLFSTKRALGKRRRTESSDAEDHPTTVQPIPGPSSQQPFRPVTNSPGMPNEDRSFAFEDDELEGSQLPHPPGDWGLYHTREALYYPPHEPSTSGFRSTPLNFDGRSILSFMRPPPQFYCPQPGL